MASIIFEYLYRDEDNYKSYGEIIFSNPNHLPIEYVTQSILTNLIEGSWFDPDKWGIPRFSFHQHNPFGIHDHLWYEFANISLSNEKCNSQTIDEFIKRIEL